MSTIFWGGDVKVAILTPRKILFSGEAVEVILPAEDGEMSVWDFHQPCICRLKDGHVRVKPQPEEDKIQNDLDFSIRRGMARAGVQALTVLVEDVPLEMP